MTPIDMLKKDHKDVRALFRQFEEAGHRAFAHKKRIAEETFAALEVHTKIEEEIFYPAVRAADHIGNGMILQATEEHSLVKSIIFDLQMTSPDAAEYDARFKVLSENVRHHIEAEEAEMLPYAAAQLDKAQLDELCDRMVVRKQELTAERPSLISGALQHAKQLVARAFDALTAPTPSETGSGLSQRSTSERSRRSASRRSAGDSMPHLRRRGKKVGAGTHTVCAAGKTPRAARTLGPRKTGGRAIATDKRSPEL